MYVNDLRSLADAGKGGKYQPELEILADSFGQAGTLPMELVPKDSVLREFIGGLDISD